jgi:hypothetical protein
MKKNVLVFIFDLNHMSKNNGLFRLGLGWGKVWERFVLGQG